MSPPPPLPPTAVYTSCYCEENVYLLAQAFAQHAESPGRADGEAWPWEAHVVFLSNGAKTVALWSQKACPGGAVVWDYHVLLLLRPLPRDRPHTAAEGDHGDEAHAPPPHLTASPATRPATANYANADPDRDREQRQQRDQAWVYDFDTTLRVPCPWREYVAGTFPYAFDDGFAAHIDPQFLSLFRVIPADVYLDHFASDRSHMLVPVSASGAVETETQGDPTDTPGLGNTSTAAEREPTGTNSIHTPSPLAACPDAVNVAHEADRAAPGYSMPPPPYPALRGAQAQARGVVHNLMDSFVAMAINPVPVAEEEEEGSLPAAEREVGPPEDEDAAAAVATEAVSAGGTRTRSVVVDSVQYGQVMEVAGFVRWLSQTREPEQDSGHE